MSESCERALFYWLETSSVNHVRFEQEKWDLTEKLGTEGREEERET